MILDSVRRYSGTITVAIVAAAITAAAPAVGHGVEHALFAHNADKVDGLHAVASSATIDARKGRLVATNPTTGRLPNNIIAKAPDANLLDGIDSTGFVQGTGNVYRGRLQLMHDPEDSGTAVGQVVVLPGFGDVQGHCDHRSDFAGVSRLGFSNDSGTDLDAWWFQKGGVGFATLDMTFGRFADLTSFTPDTHVVVLQLSRSGRTATIVATQRVANVGDDDAECTYSAQAIAQID